MVRWNDAHRIAFTIGQTRISHRQLSRIHEAFFQFADLRKRSVCHFEFLAMIKEERRDANRPVHRLHDLSHGLQVIENGSKVLGTLLSVHGGKALTRCRR